MDAGNPATEDFYDGSRLLEPLASRLDVHVDMVNFVFTQIVGLFLASLFRSTLHISKSSSTIRHIFTMSVGIAFACFCYGHQAVHIFALPIVCYLIIRTNRPEVVQRNVFVVAMLYLMSVHLLRQLFEFDCSSIDITGPMMIITQKVTSLSFGLYDGLARKPETLTNAQKYHALEKVPTTVEFFSYVWHFQCIMAGPLVFYKDYIEFIEGTNYSKHSANSITAGQMHEEPTPLKAVIRKIVGSVVCVLIFLKGTSWYPISTVAQPTFFTQNSYGYSWWYLLVSTTVMRFKYYFAWLLADAVCNNSGLGFAGYDKDGNSKWDLISNISVLGFELSSNLREAITSWNCGTNKWLRMLVYERVSETWGTSLTFLLSAVWHGFYPGYYLTFGTAALMVSAARQARRMFRHRFQRTQYMRVLYDVLTCLTTRFFLAYTTFPFIMLTFYDSMNVYLNMYMSLHIACLVVLFVLPHVLHAERRNNELEVRDMNAAPANNVEMLEPRINAGAEIEDGIKAAAAMATLNGNNLSMEHLWQKNMIATAELPMRQGSGISPSESMRVPHDQCEFDQISCRLKEKLDAEARSIEEFIDKTATRTMNGIVEFSNDLMRDINSQEVLGSPTSSGYRKRITSNGNSPINGSTSNDGGAAFLKKEINAVVLQQSNVLPAVISNGHAK